MPSKPKITLEDVLWNKIGEVEERVEKRLDKVELKMWTLIVSYAGGLGLMIYWILKSKP